MEDWFASGGSGKGADTTAILDGVGVLEGLTSIVELGGLLSLGLTRDGGALGVTVTVDGRWRREYFRDGEELASWLAEAVPAVRAAVEALTASSAQGSRTRRTRGL